MLLGNMRKQAERGDLTWTTWEDGVGSPIGIKGKFAKPRDSRCLLDHEEEDIMRDVSIDWLCQLRMCGPFWSGRFCG